MNCPTCNSKKVGKSRRANAGLVFPLTLFMVWVRCYSCGRKFCRFGLLPGNKIPQVAVSAEKGLSPRRGPGHLLAHESNRMFLTRKL